MKESLERRKFTLAKTIALKMKNSRDRRKFILAEIIAFKMKNSRERRKIILANTIALEGGTWMSCGVVARLFTLEQLMMISYCAHNFSHSQLNTNLRFCIVAKIMVGCFENLP